jgi:acetyltransferase-like isoleucine patch superfamily enzyme
VGLKSTVANLFMRCVWMFKTRGIAGRRDRNARFRLNSRIRSWEHEGSIAIGEDFSMGYNSELYVWRGKITIGRNSSINDNCKIYENITIGSNCLLASNIFLSSGSHTFNDRCTLPIKVQDTLHSVDRPIFIEDDCWIGHGVVIMPGIYIGKGAVIGANSVVTKNIFPYTVNAGIPCRQLSTRFDFENAPLELLSTNPDDFPFFYRGINYRSFKNTDALERGIEIESETSCFLLKNEKFTSMQLEGHSVFDISIEVIVNDCLVLTKKISKGTINLTIPIRGAEKDRILADAFPDFIKEKFAICTIISSGEKGITWFAKRITMIR